MNYPRTTGQLGLSYKSTFRTLLLFLCGLFLVLPRFALAAQLDSGLMSKAQNNDGVRIMVKLKTSMPEAPASSGPNNRAWRDAITQSQTQLLDALEGRTGNQSKSSKSGETKKVKGVKKFRYHPFLAMQADPEILNQLANNPDVVAIQEDVADPPSLAQSIPLVGANTAWTMGSGYTGNGWTVAILDTGVDKTHSFLSGKVVSEACYSTNSGADVHSVCPGGVEATTAVGSGVDCSVNDPLLTVSQCNHGTHVAGIAAGDSASFSGVAKDANIIAIQVFSRFNTSVLCRGVAPCIRSYSSDQILGLERVLQLSASMNIASANMSLSGTAFSNPCDYDVFRKTVIDNLRTAKIATAISSGNGSLSNAVGSPGCISTAISVGSTTKLDTVSSFSNSASFLKLLAPGSSINSSVPPSNGFTIFNGTSMAAPHVAGTWALMRQANPTASVTEVLTALQTSGQPILDTRNNLTHPRIQVDAAITALLASNTVGFASPLSNHLESDGAVNVEVNLLNAQGVAVTVDYAVAGGTATGGGVDYTLANGTVTFNPGQQTQSISVPITEDAFNEADETVIITLSNPTNTTLGGTPSHTLTIKDSTPPTVSFISASGFFQEAGGSANIGVRLSTTALLPVTLDYAVSGGTATGGGVDYTLANGTVTFIPGQLTESISVPIVDDALDEPHETIIVTLSNSTNATMTGTPSHTLTILDSTPPTVSFSTASSASPEGDGLRLIQSVVLSKKSLVPVTVDFAVTGGTATGGGVDYTLANGTVTFPPNVTSRNISLQFVQDTLVEPDETIIVTLSNPTNATLGGTLSHTLTILDFDTLPRASFDITSSAFPESGGSANISMKLTKTYVLPVTVDYAVTGGTATGGGVDYTLANGTVTFDPGQLTKSISIPIIDDGLDEPNETIIITLSNPTNATMIGTPSHTLTIQDSTPPTVSFVLASSSYHEVDALRNIPVVLNKTFHLPVTVDYTVTGGTATGGGVDYTLANGTVTINPGQPNKFIPILLFEDTLDETNETVFLTLSNPTNALLGGTSSQTLLIIDNDSAPTVSFSAASSAFQESDGSVDIPVALNTTSGIPVTVNYAVTGGTATTGTDFNLASGSVTFNPGEVLKTFPLSIIDNSVAQAIANRTVVITLSNPANATLGTPNPHTATIQDDDLPEISFLSFGSVGQESLQSATMELHLSNPAEYAITAEYAAVGGNATGGGVDYDVPGNMVTFPAGQTTATVPVTIIDDDLEEGFEEISFFLFNITGAQPGNAVIHFKTIIDDDTIPSVLFNAFTSDGPESRYPSHLWVVLSNAYKENVVVTYTVTGGTATGGGTDYFLPSGTLTFFPGDTIKEIPLFPVDDGAGDDGETIEVTLSAPVNATLGTATTHIYTLTEDIVGTNNLFIGDLRGAPGTSGDIRQFDGTTGDFLGVFGVTAANVESPGGVAFHPVTNNLYVVDTDNGDIRIFDGITGDLSQVMDLAGDHLSEPVGIGFHPETNDMFVTDKGNTGSVHVFNSYTGESLGVFGQTRSRLTNPEGGIAFHPISGNLLISDFTLGTVLEFDGTTGAYLGIFGETSTNLVNPFGLDFHPGTNNLFATDFGTKNVVQFNGATGDHIGVFGQTNSLLNPVGGIRFHPGTNNLFAADSGANMLSGSILQFDGNSGANFGSFGQTSANLILPLYFTFNQQTTGTLRATHLSNWTEQVTAVSLANFRPASIFLNNSGNTPIVYSITLNQPDMIALIPTIGLIGPNSFIEAPIYLDLTAAGINSGNVVRTVTFNNLTNGQGNSTETITFVPDGSL